MSMPRKDFELIARTIRALGGAGIPPDALTLIAREFADNLKCTNTNFDREWFITACTRGLSLEDVFREREGN